MKCGRTLWVIFHVLHCTAFQRTDQSPDRRSGALTIICRFNWSNWNVVQLCFTTRVIIIICDSQCNIWLWRIRRPWPLSTGLFISIRTNVLTAINGLKWTCSSSSCNSPRPIFSNQTQRICHSFVGLAGLLKTFRRSFYNIEIVQHILIRCHKSTTTINEIVFIISKR